MRDENKSANDAAEHSPKRTKASESEAVKNSLADLEQKIGGELISFDILKNRIPIWLSSYIIGISRYGNVDSVIQIFEFPKNITAFAFDYRYELYFYTDSNEYLIDLHGDNEVILSVKNRKVHPGEVNPRGNVLYAGQNSPDKMEWVMAQIVKNELKNLSIKATKK